ncbi:MAG TPA: glycosyltransferase family 39 protein [Vicinamibacteria bacterium]
MADVEGAAGRDHEPFSRPSLRLLALAAIFTLALALRFAHLDWGLRHPAHSDDAAFVGHAQRMLDEGHGDHRYYFYPGLFFYLLAPVLRVFGDGSPPGPASFFAARALVAAFGALNVLLLYRLGRQMEGPRAGWVAALLLAVSPVAVEQAHTVHPDVVLQTFVLLALLAFRKVGAGHAGDLVSGAALGLAGAVKFSGIFLVPAYVVARGLAPGRRGLGFLAAGATALAVFILASPYSVLRARDFLGGVRTQVAFHAVKETAPTPSYASRVTGYAAVWPKALGWPAVLLAAYGLVRVRRERRAWAPLLTLALVTLAVMGTSRLRFDRHMLPSLGVPILLAALGLEAAGARRRGSFVLLAAGVVAVPLWSTVTYLRAIGVPSTRDRTLDWMRVHVEDGLRVLSSVELFDADRDRLEVLTSGPLRPDQRLQALNVDFLVVGGEDDPRVLEGLTLEFVSAAANRFSGTELRVFSVPPALRPRYRTLEARPPQLRASVEPDRAGLAVDGRRDTSWSTGRPQRAGDWIEVAWAEEVRVARIELRLDSHPRRQGRALRVLVAPEQGAAWSAVPSAPGRPPVEHQGPSRDGFSQILLLPPTRGRLFRLELIRDAAHQWAVSEVRFDDLESASEP